MRLISAAVLAISTIGFVGACTDAFTATPDKGGAGGHSATSGIGGDDRAVGGKAGDGGAASGACSPNPCKFGSRCKDAGAGDYDCTCVPGATGSDCEEIDEPESDAASLVFWLDAADGQSTHEEGGTLRSWNDRKSNYVLGLTATSAHAPKLVQGGLYNLPVVRFDGSDDWMSHPNFEGLKTATESTIALVGYAAGADQTLLSGYAIHDGTAYYGLLLSSLPGAEPGALQTLHHAPISDGTGGTGPEKWSSTQSDAASTSKSNLIVVIRAGGFLRIRVNGVEKAQVPNTGGVFGKLMNLEIGRQVQNVGGAKDYLAGDVAEVLIYDAALGEEGLRQLEGYLRFKWSGSPLPP